MKKTLTLLFLICMVGTAVAQDQMADQLRKAIVEEEANQNLDKAITAYNTILDQYDKQRATAATALFHLADCYRKQGNDEKAVDAYQRVIRDFSEQTELADASRNYLVSVYNVRIQQDIEAENRDRVRRAVQEQMLEREKARKKDFAIRQAEIEAANKRLEIIMQNIDLVEHQIREAEKGVEAGTAHPSELYPLKKELLSLQERLTDMQFQMKIYGIQN